MVNNFSHTVLGNTGLKVHRLGFAATYRPGIQTVRRALEAGINYFFAYGIDTQLLKTIGQLTPSEKQKLVVSSGTFKLGIYSPNIRKSLEKRLRQIKSDYIDVFLWLGVQKEEDFRDEIRTEFERFKAEGKVRFIGISGHDRKLHGKFAGEGKLDILMLRYNAAHRGAETEIFPHLEKHNPGVVSYTATRWRYLMQRPKGWPKDSHVPTAAECYRFVLQNPNVHVCLTAPSNKKQFEENLAAIEAGPLNDEDYAYICKVGDAVRHKKKLFG